MTFTLHYIWLVLYYLREPLVLSPYIYCYITFTFALQCEPRVLAPPSHAARREKMTGDDAFLVAPPAPRDDERRRRPTPTIFSSLFVLSRASKLARNQQRTSLGKIATLRTTAGARAGANPLPAAAANPRAHAPQPLAAAAARTNATTDPPLSAAAARHPRELARMAGER